MPEESAEEQAPVPGTGHEGQTFLVGEHIYLRTIEESDAEFAASWRLGDVRPSVTATKSWIEDDLKDEEDLYLVIVRKGDDRPVGCLRRSTWKHNVWYNGDVDPIFGQIGQAWLGEALCMAVEWDVYERHHIAVQVANIPGDYRTVIRQLESIGARVATSFREHRFRGGRFVEGVTLVVLNPSWVATLGDPFTDEKPRSGSGGPRPVIAPVELSGSDLPLNAVRVGPRVYLRPLQKADALEIMEASRRETEPAWNVGRAMYTQTSMERWFEELGKNEPQTWVRFAVCLRENDQCIGVVGIDSIDYRNRCAESESEFHNRTYRAKGYGTEAKHLLFDYAFNTLELHSLQSWVLYTNTRSAAALRKQGYRDVGIEPWWMPGPTGFQHMGTYELLADEWRARPRARVDDVGELAGET